MPPSLPAALLPLMVEESTVSFWFALTPPPLPSFVALPEITIFESARSASKQ